MKIVPGLLKRWGPFKKLIWEKEYKSGKWDTRKLSNRPVICTWIERYCNGGLVLDLGCGDAIIGGTLTENLYSSYIGVDISQMAIAKATSENRRSKNKFIISDIEKYYPDQKANVILFRYSLYYLGKKQIKMALKKYQKYLTDNGVFIVAMDDINRHAGIIELIKSYFKIMEKCIEGEVVILVFR